MKGRRLLYSFLYTKHLKLINTCHFTTFRTSRQSFKGGKWGITGLNKQDNQPYEGSE